MGQLTKNDFISCSLECLTLNLNICQSLQNVLRGSISSSQMSDTIRCSVSCPGCLQSLLFPASHISHSHHLKHHPHSGSHCPGPWLGGGREDVVLCQLYFFRFTPRAEIPVPASKPARASPVLLQDVNPESWIMMNG